MSRTDEQTIESIQHVIASPVAAATGVQTSAKVIEFISFAIGNDQYGVDIMAVREIKGWAAITHLPKQPAYVHGVLNLRGVIVPIVDLRCRFGQGLTEPTPLHIVIIVQIGERQIGLIGDRVLDIVSVDADRIQPVPRTDHGHSTSFLAGLVSHDDVMIALIDLPHLLADQADNDVKTVILDA
ncbi:MAG: chemotaxis protein CheW [Proteobacteria bacterium]|nr:chemotaxis protein CheW [Pseudomonadota bacterium]